MGGAFDIVIAKNISGIQRNVPNMKRIIPLWGQAGGQYEGRAWLEKMWGRGRATQAEWY